MTKQIQFNVRYTRVEQKNDHGSRNDESTGSESQLCDGRTQKVPHANVGRQKRIRQQQRGAKEPQEQRGQQHSR